MGKKSLISIIIGGIIFALPTYALEISLGPAYSDLEISGTVKSEGTEIDLEEDLGMEGEEGVSPALELKLGKHNFLFCYDDVEFKGEKILTKTITFRDTTYAINTLVESQLKYALYELEYWYELLELEEGIKCSLAPLFKISVYDAEVSLKGGGVEKSYDQVLPILTIGFLSEVGLTEYLSVGFKGCGIGYSGDKYFEYEGFLKISPVEYFNLEVGYANRCVDFSKSEDLIDIDIEGLFVKGFFKYEF